jgi:amidase/aspartyl-tRNA(Asn)/glutamyl-tRNA(Gln) amidotransferase subunit A
VSRPSAFGTHSPFVLEGVLTRTVEDAALGLTALAGYDSADPFSLDQRIDLMGALRRSVKGLRLAFHTNINVFPADPDVAACRSLAAA